MYKERAIDRYEHSNLCRLFVPRAIRFSIMLLASAIWLFSLGHVLASPHTPLVHRDLVNSSACADTHLMLARGTTESYPGTLSTLATLIANGLSTTTTYEDVIYPATDETATDSYFIGRKSFASQLAAYAAACTKARIVVLSYSQVWIDQHILAVLQLLSLLCPRVL